MYSISSEAFYIIPNYPNYLISEQGNIKSKVTGKLLKSKNNRGYRQVVLCHCGVCKTLSVHRLVAITFLPNPLKLKVVNHLDNNKSNNAAINLAWCDYSYNNAHAYLHGHSKTALGKGNRKTKLDREKVIIAYQICQDYTSAAKLAGCSNATVWNYINERSTTSRKA